MSRIHYVNTGPWPVYIGFTTSPAAFAKEMKRLGIEGEVDFLGSAMANASTHHLYPKSDGMLCCIITMPEPDDDHSKEQYAGLLAHEALHVIQEMRSAFNKGDPFDRESEAYLLQMIVQDFLQVAWDTGRERRVVPK